MGMPYKLKVGDQVRCIPGSHTARGYRLGNCEGIVDYVDSSMMPYFIKWAGGGGLWVYDNCIEPIFDSNRKATARLNQY